MTSAIWLTNIALWYFSCVHKTNKIIEIEFINFNEVFTFMPSVYLYTRTCCCTQYVQKDFYRFVNLNVPIKTGILQNEKKNKLTN